MTEPNMTPGTPEQELVTAAHPRSWRRVAIGMVKNPLTLLCLIVVLVLVIFAFWPVALLPHNPEVGTGGRFQQPVFLGGTTEHILGTDRLGRDILSMLIAGTRYTLLIVFAAATISVLIGTVAGLVSGYYGGVIDAIIMRLCDVTLAFPVMVLLIAMTAVLGTSLPNLIIILGVAAWAAYARIVRGAVLAIKEREFVEAAKAIGLPDWKIMLRHILPNCLTAIIVFMTFELAGLILVESALSFLGFGLQPPTPSWGKMVADARGALYDAWWASAIPGLIIVFAVLAFSLIGDDLRDRLDPRTWGDK